MVVNGSIDLSRQEPIDGVQSMIKSATPEGLLPDPRVHAAWALFFSRFISAYQEQVVVYAAVLLNCVMCVMWLYRVSSQV